MCPLRRRIEQNSQQIGFQMLSKQIFIGLALLIVSACSTNKDASQDESFVPVFSCENGCDAISLDGKSLVRRLVSDVTEKQNFEELDELLTIMSTTRCRQDCRRIKTG